MKIKAFAKINAGLCVKNRRPDGFHNIETVFVRIGLCDLVTLARSPRTQVECSDPSVPGGSGNLAFAAAELVRRAFRLKESVAVRIQKCIPAGAGLAGGSADAAAVVRGMVRLYGIRPAPEKLLRILRALGSDVPFCYTGGTMLGRGRGERLRPLPPFPQYTLVLVKPPVSVPTAWAYGRLKRNLTPDKYNCRLYSRYLSFCRGGLAPREYLRNDFEGPVFKRFPAVGKIKEEFAMYRPDGVLMSGSGSTVFGLFEQGRRARAAAARFRKKGFWVCITRPMTH